MTTQQKRVFRPKKLSFNEPNFLVKTGHSPDASSHRKFQQTKANIFQFANQQGLPFTTVNSPTTFSLVLNGNTIKLDQLKSPKSVKLASFRVPATGKTSKSPMTLNEISPSPSPSFRENANRRVLKSHSTAPKTNPELICPPINPEINASSSFRKSFVGSVDLMTMLNAKTEELDSLQRNVSDLQLKVHSLASARQENENEIESVETLQRDLFQKDQMIELYTKLLTLLSKGNKEAVSFRKAHTVESPKKQKIHKKGFRIETNLKQGSKADSQPNSGSFTTILHKSTNPTTSPNAEKNDSRWNSRITEQESNASKEDILSISPSYRMNTKDSSGRFQKDGKVDFKLKVLKSIYGTENRTPGKTGLSHILSDVTGDTKKLNRTSSQEPELSSTPSIQELAKKQSQKGQESVGKQLINFMGKLDSFFSKMENERKTLTKRNEEIIDKIEQLIQEKTKRSEAI